MAQTVGDFISDVRNQLKALNKDDRISGRFIYSLAIDIASGLLAQRRNKDTFRDSEIFTEVRCLPMKRIKSVECDIVEFRTCDKIMKSVNKLPKIYNSGRGPAVIGITNIDNSKEYELLRTRRDYKKRKLRMFSDEAYAYILDGHLYIVGAKPERISIVALFLNPRAAQEASDCSECDECDSILEHNMPVPSKYMAAVKDQVIERLANITKRIMEDENPDMDEHQKTRKQ